MKFRLILLFLAATALTADWRGASATGTFLITPYVFSVTGDRIAVGWQYLPAAAFHDATSVKVMRKGQLIDNVPIETDHDLNYVLLPIPKCGFGDDLAYEVPGQSAPVRITDIPCADARGTARFSFLADTQGNPEYVNIESLRKFPGSAVIYGGDLVDKGSDYDQWVRFFEATSLIGRERVMYPAVGNHEYRRDADVPNWKHFFRVDAADAFYAFDLGPAHIIVLNSCFEDDRTLIDRQLDFLKKELSTDAKWKIVVFHHPPFANSIANDKLFPRKEFQILQDLYVPLFELYHVDLVLNGHTHIFERSVKNGVNYLTAGPGGGKMGIYRNLNPYSVITERVRTMTHIEATETGLRATTLSKDGETLDDLILKK